MHLLRNCLVTYFYQIIFLSHITERNSHYSSDSFGDKCKHDLEINNSFRKFISFIVKPLGVIFKV